MSGQCLSSDVSGHALTPDTRCRLGEPLPHQQADRTWIAPGPPELCPQNHAILWGHRVLPALSQRNRSSAAMPESGVRYPCIPHPFATNFPSGYPSRSPFDLHALATPPAFVLSQDQTLQLKFASRRPDNQSGRLDLAKGSHYSSVVESESSQPDERADHLCPTHAPAKPGRCGTSTRMAF